ncbi:MAG: hypothetical protein R3A12_12850 [Ignavibacteria bacterium]
MKLTYLPEECKILKNQNLKSYNLSDLSAEKIKLDITGYRLQEYTLDNGLKVVLESKHGNIPMAAVNTTFHVGSKDEDEDKTGLAHLF